MESFTSSVVPGKASTCKSKKSKKKKKMLWDRLVCGVNYEAIQKRLLSEKALTYEKALNVTQDLEVAEKDTKHFKSGATGTAQQILYHGKGGKDGKLPPPGTGQKTCYRCGRDHLAPTCRHKDTEYDVCKKKGHLARVCRSKKHEDETKETKKPPQRRTCLSQKTLKGFTICTPFWMRQMSRLD